MIDLRQRIKLLMEYDSKLTNSENVKKLINEQSAIGAPIPGLYYSAEDDSKPKEEEKI
jgi:hypothetical protein